MSNGPIARSRNGTCHFGLGDGGHAASPQLVLCEFLVESSCQALKFKCSNALNRFWIQVISATRALHPDRPEW
jgi:hypothetical protein